MSESSPPLESFESQARRCAVVFAALLVGLALMVACSFTSLALPVRIGLILTAAALNASLVSCYLMHLLSERKFIFTVLVLTGILFVGLLALTVVAHHDVPHLPAA